MKNILTANFKYLLTPIFVLSSFGFTSSETSAAILTDRDLISVFQMDNSYLTATTTNSTAASYSQNLPSSNGNVIKGYGDLTTGKVGTSVDSTNGTSGQIIVQIFDTLKFNTIGDTPALVSFDYTYDGSIYEPIGLFTNAYAESLIGIYDITGMTSWLETVPFVASADLVTVISSASTLAFERISFEQTSKGVLSSFSQTVTGSFLADPTKTYGIRIGSNSVANYSISNFYNTGTFEFTELNGSTFESGSGVFLSAAASTVPTPATLWLIGIGLVGLFGVKRNVHTTDSL